MEAFDNELHNHLRDSEYEGECQECQTPIDEEFGYCSTECYKASMIQYKYKNKTPQLPYYE